MQLEREHDRADAQVCTAAIRGGSRSFHAAGLLLPRAVRRDALALYAFCRQADDLIDGAPDPQAALDALQSLRGRLQRIYAGRPEARAEDRAFAAAVARHGIPIELPEALLEGFCWDAQGRRYETLEELLEYAMRVAGTVGIMMALIMGATAPAALARAAELGVAMQLSNIARDVGEDARAGRLYLPLEWMSGLQLDARQFLSMPRASPALAAILARLLGCAESLYARAASGVPLLPATCRPAIQIALQLYRDIGRQVARNGLDSVSARAVVGGRRKLLLAARGLCSAWSLPVADVLDAPALPQARALLVATASGVAQRTAAPTAWWDLHGRLVLAIELFERLEYRAAQRSSERLRGPLAAG